MGRAVRSENVARLAVNVDHVATLRQARGIDEPDPAWAAVLAEKAGCDGIIAHLREDRRHVQDRDMRVLKNVVKGEFNMEMGATEEMIGIALDLQPDQCCLDVAGNLERIKEVTARLNQGGIRVSLFIDPTPEQVKASSMCGAQVVELHTGAYCNLTAEGDIRRSLDEIEDSARLAGKLKMKVAAGHGLNLRNVRPLLSMPEIEEYSIGHSIVSRAVFVGFEEAVKEIAIAMILGIGIDLAKAPRIDDAYRRFGRRFLERCFTKAEAELCLGRPKPGAALAMRFAAKEAFSKAAGLGMRGLAWREIEVAHDPRGRPYLILHGRAKAWAEQHGVKSSHLSLSDDGDYAAAVVVLEG